MPYGIYKRTEQGRKNLSLSHKGKKPNDALLLWRLNGGKSLGRPKGTIPWNKGKKGLQIAWNKGLKGFLSGKKHYKYIEDRTKLSKHNQRNDYAYVEWRKKVIKRDGVCRMKSKSCKGYLIVHHILKWSEYPEERYNVNNGITLCQIHHPLKKVDEKNLIPTFQELVALKKY